MTEKGYRLTWFERLGYKLCFFLNRRDTSSRDCWRCGYMCKRDVYGEIVEGS